MTYKLFIDDERYPVTDDWTVARTSNQAIQFVGGLGIPEFISFDHDLGDDDTAIQFVNWLTDELIEGRMAFPEGFDYYVHSQNPIGRDNIIAKMDQLLKHFTRG